jgi:hypothetical protein
MTDLRKAAEGALAVMTAKPSSITAADWADAIDALRAALAEPTITQDEIAQGFAERDAERAAMRAEIMANLRLNGWRQCAVGQRETQHCGLLAAAVEAEREACIKIIGAYQIPVGNSPAGEMARDWTYDALKEIRDEIRERGESK